MTIFFIPEFLPCKNDPCVNHGHCTKTATSFECECPKHYTGTTCESKYNKHIHVVAVYLKFGDATVISGWQWRSFMYKATLFVMRAAHKVDFIPYIVSKRVTFTYAHFTLLSVQLMECLRTIKKMIVQFLNVMEFSEVLMVLFILIKVGSKLHYSCLFA